MTCKDCIHYEVCETEEWFTEDFDNPDCPYFKDKSRYIELPCKAGDTVYVLKAEYTECHLGATFSEFSCQGCEEAECESVEKYSVRELSNINKWTILDYLWQGRFGKDVFLTRGEAEKALKKRSGQ